MPWWWDHLAAQARALSLAGFTAVWLPPVLKTASGWLGHHRQHHPVRPQLQTPLAAPSAPQGAGAQPSPQSAGSVLGTLQSMLGIPSASALPNVSQIAPSRFAAQANQSATYPVGLWGTLTGVTPPPTHDKYGRPIDPWGGLLSTGLGADGYGPFDDYDIGSRNQKGSVPSRYGTREQLQRCVAILRANGLDAYLDMVEHQRIGDVTPFVFRYPGANGTPNAGRFPKNPANFVPQVPRDPNLGGPVADDFAFGRELAPINARPPRYVFDNLVAAGDWLTRALDAQGYRVDDVKGLSTDFLFPFLTSKSMAGKFAGRRVLRR